MPFVRRDNQGNIIAKFTMQQSDSLEWLPDNSPELLPPIGVLRDAKWTEIKAARSSAIAAGFTFDGKEYQSDPVSLANINGAVSGVMTAESLSITPDDVPWTAADNTVSVLTPTHVKQLGLTAMAHVQEQYARGVVLRGQIEAAPNKAALDAITWS